MNARGARRPDAVILHGVRISSRYGVARELRVMQEVVEVFTKAWPPPVPFESIWCDSKACSTYSVQAPRLRGFRSVALAGLLDAAFRKVAGGHNGIVVETGEPEPIFVDPWWNCDAVPELCG